MKKPKDLFRKIKKIKKKLKGKEKERRRGGGRKAASWYLAGLGLLELENDSGINTNTSGHCFTMARKVDGKPQTPPSKPRLRPKAAANPKPSSLTGKVKKPGKPNEKEVEHSMPMKELSNTQITKMLSHAGKSPAISNTQYEFPVDGSPSRGQAKSSAVIRAQEVRSKLELCCFWMPLSFPPLYFVYVFCVIGASFAVLQTHLPDKDITMTLEDESGRQYQLKYIACKTGLSAGWRQFAASHNLLEGDVLVFQLVESTKFKVYIIRSNGIAEVDGALCLLNLDNNTKQKDSGKFINLSVYKDNAETSTTPCNDSIRKRAHSPQLVVPKKKKIGLQRAKQSENDSEEAGSEVSEDLKSPAAALQFEDIQSYENFHILVDGLFLDSEFPEDVRKKYYKLCCSQKAFLHENVIKGMNLNLIIGAISETVNIADSIKACKVTTPRDDFVSWDKYLSAFELLGMNVGFLHDRICRLANLADDSGAALEAKMYKEARIERSQAGIGIRNIEVKLEEMREACDEFGAAIESLRSKAEINTLKFQEEVTAPW
ncbi:B3 domain-containing protein [Pyrus ussuriensis x Pyrus communis]|uniref:B3 domain-containing protein n=1 Tax=Pyrus ussuriensis x Pyrus communis TaxID=2448454 RepID=A0A5N5HEJ1_9ROSA|nr:B3 domain-containing protein [Pyrus ussuriensis x Pyrus communis]